MNYYKIEKLLLSESYALAEYYAEYEIQNN